jgi:hypothetical protein
MSKLKRYVLSFFYKKPKQELTWSLEDFNKGKKWAMTQPNPYDKNKSLWDLIYSPRLDSIEIINEINKRLWKK